MSYVVTVTKKSAASNGDEVVYQQTVELEPDMAKLVQAVNTPKLPF